MDFGHGGVEVEGAAIVRDRRLGRAHRVPEIADLELALGVGGVRRVVGLEERDGVLETAEPLQDGGRVA